MQCPNCGFQNMPGSEVCARCSTSLQLAVVALDVHPPRAGKLAKQLRRVAPIRAASHKYVQHADRIDRARRIWALVWRLIVPGWAQWYRGRGRHGAMFLGAVLFFAAASVYNFGSALGDFCIAGLFTAHLWSIIDVFNDYFPKEEFGPRFARATLAMLLLGVIVYLPIYNAVENFAQPLVYTGDSATLHNGDVVLVNYRYQGTLWPRRGQVVLYETHVEIDEGYWGRERQIYQAFGQRIDRVLAVGGDHVRWVNGLLYVNGQLSPFRPLNPNRGPQNFETTVNDACVLILPSTLNAPDMEPGGNVWMQLAMVPQSSLDGLVYWRMQPHSEFGRIQ